MSYHCGLGAGIPGGPREPHILCDGCELKYAITRSHVPPSWFLNEKAPPKWKKILVEGKRKDYCVRCKATHDNKSSQL